MWSQHRSYTRIKLCEIESRQDLHAACQARPDALGFHWFAHHDAEARRQTFSVLWPLIPRGVNRVLLSDLDFAELLWVCSLFDIDTIQLYPDWDKAQVAAWRAAAGRDIRILKLLSAQPHENFTPDTAAFLSFYHDVVDGFLLDSYRAGGTGTPADWDHCATIVRAARRPVFLAGGLTADNVGEAIARVRPFGVDVESGVSDRLPSGALGKNPDKCCGFVTAVRTADDAGSARRKASYKAWQAPRG